jgi:hypothetical protein
MTVHEVTIDEITVKETTVDEITINVEKFLEMKSLLMWTTFL